MTEKPYPIGVKHQIHNTFMRLLHEHLLKEGNEIIQWVDRLKHKKFKNRS